MILRMYAWTRKPGIDGSSGNHVLLSDKSTVVTVTVNNAVEPGERHHRLRRALHLGALARHPTGTGPSGQQMGIRHGHADHRQRHHPDRHK